MNRDQYGIIGQIQPDKTMDGGDSVCWTGHYVYLTNSRLPFVKTFETSFGAYVRHPEPELTKYGFGSYYKNAWNGCISRDQLTGILIGLIAQKEYLAILRLILHHSLRAFLFSYNTIKNGDDPTKAKWKMPDITFMDIWALELRGFGKLSWIFWPLLCVLDLHLLFGAIFDRYFDNQEEDVINFIGKILISREHIPTPISYLATKFINKENILNRLQKYWCGWRDNCEFVFLYKQKIDKVLK